MISTVSWDRIRFIWGVACIVLGVGCRPPQPTVSPVALAHAEFAAVIDRISEPPGYFDSDNLVSNETGYLHVLSQLKQTGVRGGAYIGVGPDQNFTYIAKIRPRYAFIVDIRRGNFLEHLMFKALFEVAENRQEYLALLFSKPVRMEATPSNSHAINKIALSSDASIAEMVAYFDQVEGEEAQYRRNLDRLLQRVSTYGLALSSADLETITRIYRAFFTENLELRFEYNSVSRQGLSFPSYRAFLLATDLNGRYENFLNSNEEFALIKDMQATNLIIPVTGDFAGEQALDRIAAYIRDRGDFVSAFYLSNVEFYLVPDGLMDRFAANVKRLPVDDRSVLIRAFMNTPTRRHPATVGDLMMTNVLQSIKSFNRLFEAGKYRTYWDVGTLDYIR